jgi:hypothetical protein
VPTDASLDHFEVGVNMSVADFLTDCAESWETWPTLNQLGQEGLGDQTRGHQPQVIPAHSR